MNDTTAKIEALLFYKEGPATIQELATACDTNQQEARKAVAELETQLTDRGLTLINNEGEIQLVTDTRFSDTIRNAHEQAVDANLTNAQSEALAVIAYLAPTTKPAIDFVRGVNSRAVLRNLSTRGLIKKDRSGEQVTYNITHQTLAHLGISSLQELPEYEATKNKLHGFIDTKENQGKRDKAA